MSVRLHVKSLLGCYFLLLTICKYLGTIAARLPIKFILKVSIKQSVNGITLSQV